MKPRSLSLVLFAFVAILLAILVVPALGDSGSVPTEHTTQAVVESSNPSSTTMASTTTSTTVAPTPTTSTTTSTTSTTSTTIAPTTTTSTTTSTTIPVVTPTTDAPATTTTTAPPPAVSVKAPVTTTATAVPVTTTTTVPPTTTTTAPPQDVGGYDPSAEAQFVSLVNNLRASVGIPTLANAGDLRSYARSWSHHMWETDTFEHSSLYDIPGPWQSVAENIAVSTSVQSAFNALVSSSGHYANMVNPTFTEIGSGVWTDAGGKLWVTHVFRG